MTNQPEALRLADEICNYARYGHETEQAATLRRRNAHVQAAAELRRLHVEVERLQEVADRYKWLADRVLACDYGDNNAPGEQIGWRIRGDLRADAEPFMLGASIDAAIDAALKDTK